MAENNDLLLYVLKLAIHPLVLSPIVYVNFITWQGPAFQKIFIILQTEIMLYSIAACPANCDKCSTTDKTRLDQSATPEVRQCDQCSAGFYWDSTKKECTGKYQLGNLILTIWWKTIFKLDTNYYLVSTYSSDITCLSLFYTLHIYSYFVRVYLLDIWVMKQDINQTCCSAHLYWQNGGRLGDTVVEWKWGREDKGFSSNDYTGWAGRKLNLIGRGGGDVIQFEGRGGHE